MSTTEDVCTEVWEELTQDYNDFKINVEEETEGKNALVRVMRKAYGNVYTEDWLNAMWAKEYKHAK